MFMGEGNLMADHPAFRGGRPYRVCPDDFERIFIEIGRLACKEHYHAKDTTITRWMNESGFDRLNELRAAHVRNQRASRKIRRPLRASEKHDANFTLARHAAQHLRIIRNGGHIVSPAGNGLWWIGTKRISSADLIALAKSRGFDPAGLRDECGSRVECKRP